MGTTAEEPRSMHSHETGHRLTADEAAFLKEFLLDSPQFVVVGDEGTKSKKHSRREKIKHKKKEALRLLFLMLKSPSLIGSWLRANVPHAPN